MLQTVDVICRQVTFSAARLKLQSLRHKPSSSEFMRHISPKLQLKSGWNSPGRKRPTLRAAIRPLGPDWRCPAPPGWLDRRCDVITLISHGRRKAAGRGASLKLLFAQISHFKRNLALSGFISWGVWRYSRRTRYLSWQPRIHFLPKSIVSRSIYSGDSIKVWFYFCWETINKRQPPPSVDGETPSGATIWIWSYTDFHCV